MFMFVSYLQKTEQNNMDLQRGKGNFAIKREQNQTCLNYAEREQSQDRKSGIKAESRKEKSERRLAKLDEFANKGEMWK